MIPDDLRHFKRPDAFALLTEEQAGAAIGLLFALLLILDRLGVFS